MDPTMNFLTAPTAAPRGGELPSPGAGTDSSPQSSEFAGVLNGQMLKLERQALASAAPPAAGLQVVPLGNKLSVITTDAPLPDMATLADFARAQGLGETAVQALFGATGPKPDVATGLTGVGIDLQLAGLAGSGAPAPTMTLSVGANAAATGPATGAQSLLAQLAASVALRDANAPGAATLATPVPALTPATTSTTSMEPAWFGFSALPVAAASAPAAVDMSALASQTSASATATATATAAPPPAAVPSPASIAIPSSTLAAANPLAWAVQQTATTAPAVKDATPQTKDKTGAGQDQDSSQAAAFVPVALMFNARLGASPKADSGEADTATSKPIPPADAVSVPTLNLASAVQAGIAAAANAQTAARGTTDAPSVQITSLSVTAKAIQRSADAAALLPVASAVSLAVQAAIAPSPVEAPLPQAPAPTSLRLTLTPPDQAITRRLAQASGNNKQISWAALLAGAKVSDVLAGATPVAPAAVPQAASGLPLPTAVPTPAGPPTLGDTSAATPLTPATPTAQTLGASDAAQKTDASNAPIAVNAASAATAGALPLNPHAATTWENVHIEVPQGLDLEALQAEHLAASDAEPSAPPAFGSAAQSGAAAQNVPVTTETQAASPQAMAEQRAAHYQQLADRVGEAIAQRLIAQIERGQWKMQMRMQPGALGQIDVQLDMHAAGLDASFSADNAMTRELMAQGANRLRDALTQAGTTVASVWVNGDSSRQSGGNPTPGRNNQGPSSASAKKTAEPAAATVAATASSAAADGLNVLA